jgi:diamine N-acetyltransferase
MQSQHQRTRERRKPHIVSGRIVLRELRREDLDEMEHWPKYTESELQWANFDLRTPGQKETWFRNELYDPTRRRLAIVVDDRVVGMVGLRYIDYRRGQATLGIRLSAGEVDKGYGTDAIMGVLSYAFQSLKLSQVNLDVAEENTRARRCYEKCGFRTTSKFRDYTSKVFIEMAVRAEEFQRESRKVD